MTIAEAFHHLTAVPESERSDLLDWTLYLELPGGAADCWAAGACAAADLAAGLDAIGSEAELFDAVRHYDSLADVLDQDEWERLTKCVLVEVLEAGAAFDARLSAVAGRN